jgi:hypothetical protein
MKKKIYWVATAFAMCIMTVSGVLAITHAAPMMRGLAHLGYPVYFSNLLGIGKLVGVAVILAPGLPLLKEWAYTAFAITVISASYSHFSAGDGLMALDPLATLAALIVSYKLRPPDRRLDIVNPPRTPHKLRVRYAEGVEDVMQVQR